MKQELIERARRNTDDSGIWGRSKAGQYFIFCVGPDKLIQDRFMRYVFDEGLKVKPLEGRYENIDEVSFIASMSLYDVLWPWFRDQEAVLLLKECNGDNERRAVLQYVPSFDEVPFGYLKQVSKEVAMAAQGYTHDPLTGAYFICN